MTRSTRAYALPLVFGLVMLLSVVLTTVLFGVAGSVTIGESMLHRRQAFHAAEGVSLAAMELAGQRLRSLPIKPDLAPSDPGFATAMDALLRDNEQKTSQFINDNKALITPAGYTVGDVIVSGLGVATQTQLDSGPFNGMLAQVQPLNLNVFVRRDHDRSPATQFVVASIQRATVSLFQFYVFSDVYLDLDPGGPVATSGRIHTNEDFCVAGEPTIHTVTAAGRILMSNRTGQQCRRRAGETNDIQIAVDDADPPTTTALTKDHMAPDWVSYAQSTFHGHVLDSAHNVSKLKMPINGKPRVQAGANVLAQEDVGGGGDRSMVVPIPEAKEDNTTSMRFLVDPMLVVEPPDVQQQKFAFQADIRIIDGVWFLKNPSAPTDIGRPIWSDHAGTVANSAALYPGNPYANIITNPKGQEDLRTSESWGPNAPERYSYYGMHPDGASFSADRTTASPRAVVSYGLLFNTGDAEHTLAPGFYSNAAVPTPALQRATNMDEVLRGAHSGFKDGWIEVRSESDGDPTVGTGRTSDESKRSRMMPMNFDVAAFLDALKTCGNHELGSYFDLCGTGRRFNGIVYIGVTWPNSLDGLGDTFATTDFAKLWPFHGSGAGLLDTDLPANLCRAGAAAPLVIPAGHTLPPCASATRAAGNFPNIVRVFNARHISPRTGLTYAGVALPANYLPAGLTIATNVSIVASGDVNVDTTPKKTADAALPSTDHFVPFLLAGDRLHRHSVVWSDAQANWRELMDVHPRVAEDTTQFMEILAGWNPTPIAKPGGHDHSSDGFEDFPRYNENWGAAGKTSTTFGSIVIGFASVFERTGANNGDGTPTGFTTSFPGRDEGYDFHLEDPAKQPPGTPQLLAQSIGFWQTR